MYLLDTKIQCPYCWETLNIFVEPLEADQTYVEDCQVCCAPIVISVQVHEGEIVQLSAARENE